MLHSIDYSLWTLVSKSIVKINLFEINRGTWIHHVADTFDWSSSLLLSPCLC